jgi:hypothetical protein
MTDTGHVKPLTARFVSPCLKDRSRCTHLAKTPRRSTKALLAAPSMEYDTAPHRTGRTIPRHIAHSTECAISAALIERGCELARVPWVQGWGGFRRVVREISSPSGGSRVRQVTPPAHRCRYGTGGRS